MEKRYIRVDVYKSGDYDCTNNGVSVTHDLFVEAERGNYTREEIEKLGERTNLITGEKVGRPGKILVVERRMICGEEYVSLKPEGDTRWLMMGGNFAYTSDSRFRETFKYPVPIHDRYEG